jgi:AAA+ ATPase superfamily predicted ATPase
VEPEFKFAFPLKTDIREASENLQTELTSLHCFTNMNQNFPEIELQEFYSYLPKEKFPLLRSFELRMISMFRSTYVCEQFFFAL